MTGFIRRTTDGGKTWTLQQSIAGHVLYGLKAARLCRGRRLGQR